MNSFLKAKVLLHILFGVAVGLVLFLLGDADDAPGLSFIGIVAAFLLIMRGIYYAKVIQKGYHIPIILFAFGSMGILLPIILFLDEEINSNAVFIGTTIGISLIAVALVWLLKVKNNNKCK